MKKWTLTLLLFFYGLSFAQISTVSSSGKWTFGGNMGISGSFGGNSGLGVFVLPRAGYKITENTEVGMQAGFHWQNSTFSSSSLFGIGPFINHYFGRKFYVGSLFQEYIINQKIKSTQTRAGSDEAALYIGGGYMQEIGNHTYLQMGAMYNVLWKKETSVFSSGFYPNVGIVFGL